jgi:phosphonate transport system ATP-binding protein
MTARVDAADLRLHSLQPTTRSVRLAVAKLAKSYGGRAAISDVSFEVCEGEFLAILGPSGAGKTTLFRCITGLTAPDDGSVRLADADFLRMHRRERRRIAVVFQQFNLVSRISAVSNVLAGRLGHVAPWRGFTKRFRRVDRLLALECLDRVGLVHKASQRADSLSGGEQQRVAIARALAQQPDVIIADEPVASLDPRISAGIMELLTGICHRDGVALVCSLHQMHLAQKYADRIVGLAQGRVVADIPAATFDTAMARRLYGSDELQDMIE